MGVKWNKQLYDRFCELAMLSEADQRLLELRIREYSLTQISDELGYSKSTVSGRVKKLLEKYDEVQQLPDSGLPKRYKSKKEKWMDR